MTKTKQKRLQTVSRLKAEAASDVERLRTELAAATAELQGYANMIDELGGVEQQPSLPDAPPPGLKAEDVRRLARSIIADNARIGRSKLYELVREKLSDESQSASGLGLHLGRILKEPWVEEVEEGAYRLSESSE